MTLSQRQVLWLAFGLNATLFVGEALAGWLIQSASLMADSLDMFADAAVYALSLAALNGTRKQKAEAAALNAGAHLLLALLLAAEVIRCTLSPVRPEPLVMSALAIAALLANGACLALLHRFRDDDINLRATWLCSRNDLLGNLAVLVAAALVSHFDSAWPDRIVGLAMAFVMWRSAWQIGREALHQRQQPLTVPS